MLQEALHVITDPGHLLAEVILELVSYATVGRLAIWWHDRQKHPSQDVPAVPAPKRYSDPDERHTWITGGEVRRICGICGGQLNQDGTHLL